MSGDSFGYRHCEWRRVLLASGERRIGILSQSTVHASLSNSSNYPVQNVSRAVQGGESLISQPAICEQ